ncbi:NTMT1 (predicted) [Pycnogonum litorale]
MIASKGTFYSDAKKYWDSTPATDDGMLGGFKNISKIESQESVRFIKPYLQGPKAHAGKHRVLDCGSGIGRVTKCTLSKLFDRIDMVEQSEKFLDAARAYLGPIISAKVDSLHYCGMQDFTPLPNHYNVIWCQWVLGHLTNVDFVDFFKRCKTGLIENGLFMVKENVTSTDQVDVDETDSSVTRPKSLMISLWRQAGLEVIAEKVQSKFPPGLYEVRMFILR